MCGQGADGGSEAKGASQTTAEFPGSVEVYLGAEEKYWDGRCVEGDVQGMGYYCDAGGAFHGRTVSVMGGTEEVAEENDGQGWYYGGRERSVWECGRGCSCWGDDAVGRSEDKADVGEGEGESWSVAREDLEGVRAEGFLCGNGSQSAVDKRWRCCLFR